MDSWTTKAARLTGLQDKDIIAWSVRLRRLFPHTGFREHQRVPLWHPNMPFVLLTSQKAGSTLGVAWFLHHAGLLTDAREIDPFVHHYEQRVFLRQPGYFEGLQEAVASKPVLKLVREPGARAYSSYLALHTTEVLKVTGDHRVELRQQVAKHVGLAPEQPQKISFAAFLSWLAASDHRRLDGHEARQVNLYEDRLPLGLPEPIQLEHVNRRLPEVEEHFGLAPSSLEQIQDFGASTHYAPKTENQDLLRTVMEEGLDLPRPREVPALTTETIAQFPRAHSHLLDAFGEDYWRYGYDTFR